MELGKERKINELKVRFYRSYAKKPTGLKEYKIHKDEIEWLSFIYNTFNADELGEDLAKEAYEKLVEYGLTDKEINDIFEKLKSDEDISKAFDKAWAKQIERNEFEKYTPFEMIKIFLGGPYELFRSFDSGLKELWDYNYKTKFRQRLILLISGIIFWILFVVGTYKYFDYKRIKEIENTDISDWERNMNGIEEETISENSSERTLTGF